MTLSRVFAAAVRLSVFAVAEGGTPAFAFLRVSADGQAVFLPAGSVRQAEPGAAPDPAGR